MCLCLQLTGASCSGRFVYAFVEMSPARQGFSGLALRSCRSTNVGNGLGVMLCGALNEWVEAG